MKATITPSQIKGTVQAPASKSSMQRACALALVRNGKTIISNPGMANDDQAAIAIIRSLGASIERAENDLVVTSKGVNPVSDQIHCGESGLGIRMFTPIAAMSDKKMTVTGEGSLLQRPMDFFEKVLPQLDIEISTNGGRLPLQVKGPLVPKDLTVDGSLSSQFLTGLLVAFAAGPLKEKKIITVTDLKSKPYIDLTLDMLKHFGYTNISHKDYREFYIEPLTRSVHAEETVYYTVEGDWSGAAFLLVAGAIAGPVMIHGLDMLSSQADKAIVDVLMDANAALAIEAKGIRIHPTKMNAFDFDATDSPDLFPPLVALAAYCNGISSIKGVSRLTHKESNRAVSLQDEFDLMGVRIDIDNDTMFVHGGQVVKGADVHSQHDHRIAMACAVAALRANSETTIENAEAVNKSFPDFFTVLQRLGASVSLDNKIRLHE